MSEHGAGNATSSGTGKYFTLRLMKSPTLSAPLYFACLAFSPQILIGSGRTPPEDLMKAFTPFELAYLFGLIYLYRRAENLIDAEEWRYIAPQLSIDGNSGFAFGRAIPAIGGATGLMEATIGHLAVAAFAKHDMKGFKEYRRELKKTSGGWSAAAEQTRWGCNHFQVGSVLLQTLGYGISRANAFVNAFCASPDVGSIDDQGLARDFRMASLWRGALAAGQSSPTVPLPPKYYPTKAAQTEALELIQNLSGDEGRALWIQKRKDDLPPYQQEPKPTEAEAAPNADAEELLDESSFGDRDQS
jgi:hypothetical protein